MRLHDVCDGTVGDLTEQLQTVVGLGEGGRGGGEEGEGGERR